MAYFGAAPLNKPVLFGGADFNFYYAETFTWDGTVWTCQVNLLTAAE
jgi:hypothetical protein